MTSTIDNIHTNILARISAVEELLNIYSNYELDESYATQVTDFIDLCADLQQNYIMATVGVMSQYYQAATVENADIVRKALYNQYVKTFHSINVVGDLKRIFVFCKRINKLYKMPDTCISECIKKYEYAPVDEVFDDRNPEICSSCKTAYTIDEKTSEFTCKGCGATEKMYGVVFEDEQFFYQEGQRTKHGKYEPTKHCRFWVERIQAKESTEIPETVINKIKRCIRREKVWIDNISCESIRGYLKQLKISKYNNHIPLIRKTITGKEPPQFTEHELKLIFMYFGLVIQIFIRIKPSEKSNCPYHPFFIYKIVEQLLNKPTDLDRKKEILSCIHLQSRDTLIENDKIWFAICDHIPEFTKSATEPCKS